MNINTQMYSTGSNFNKNARYEFKREFPRLKITGESLLNSTSVKNYALGSNGKYNLAIAPNILREMKDDTESLKGKRELVDDTKKRDDKLEKILNSHGIKLVASGTVIDSSGKVSYWATIADPKYTDSTKPDRISVKKTQQELLKDLLSGKAAFLDEYKNKAEV